MQDIGIGLALKVGSSSLLRRGKSHFHTHDSGSLSKRFGDETCCIRRD
ncbi:hypothetical protein BRPE64_BCDS06520 [Caballeronia insecticola]|uniref:Uncharacterized protein n=1 Tax=Caballeronia insecticola TaxID=758793 RepID=R4WL86_9BURK|nr:hypothetical protein BRPE64_BCDS06520 [Caballeronia insecticola]